MTTMTVTEARARLPEILDQVDAGGEVTITRHGKPVAVVMSPQSVRARRRSELVASAQRLRDSLEIAARTPLSEIKGISPEYAEELLEYVRESRDARG